MWKYSGNFVQVGSRLFIMETEKPVLYDWGLYREVLGAWAH